MVATISLFTIVQYWNEFFQGMVLSTRQSSDPLQTYIQQMVVTLDYSNMNVDQIAQAMKLNSIRNAIRMTMSFFMGFPLLFQ